MPVPVQPLLDYEKRLHARQQHAARLAEQDSRLSNARLACFVALAAVAGAVWLQALPSWELAWIPAGLFGVLVVIHQRVANRQADVQRRVAHYQAGMQRMRHEIPADAMQGPAPDAQHPYAADLDLFGRDSLFCLLCTAKTAAGEHTLARWLLEPAAAAEVHERQAAVQELRERLDLREDLSGLAANMRQSVHPQALVRWAEGPQRMRSGLQWLFAACNVAFLGSLAACLGGWVGPGPVLAAILVQALIQRLVEPQVETVMALLEQPSRELPVLARVIARLFAENVQCARLQRLKADLQSGSGSAARPIGVLGRWVDLYDSHKNQLFAVIAWLLLWGPHFAILVERWRQKHGQRVAAWLRSTGDFEALLSVAGYAFEHPTDVFPEIVPGGPQFVATGLAHPLLPLGRGISNDVRLDTQCRLLMVSGSNMSGKSTLLRTIGSNAVLALAGAPVRAQALRLSVLQLGATLRVQDSLHTGTSRFYAEVQRLRQLLELTDKPVPLLFLIDEVLHGTNSHDRAVGAGAILKSFLARGAIGLCTTHDLALTEEAPMIGAVNVHFVDDLVDGKLHFDYRMREGVVQKSNALALMRAVGLV